MNAWFQPKGGHDGKMIASASGDRKVRTASSPR
jgi:hypothetical protein